MTLLAVSVKLGVDLPVAGSGHSHQLLAFGITLRGYSNECARIAGPLGLFIEELGALEVAFHLCHEPAIVQ